MCTDLFALAVVLILALADCLCRWVAWVLLVVAAGAALGLAVPRLAAAVRGCRVYIRWRARRRIRALLRKGLSRREIADRLNREALQNPWGRLWTGWAVGVLVGQWL